MIDRAPEIWVANFGFVYVYASLTKLFLAFLMIFRVEHVKQGPNMAQILDKTLNYKPSFYPSILHMNAR